MKGKSSTSLYYMEGVAHYGLENVIIIYSIELLD